MTAPHLPLPRCPFCDSSSTVLDRWDGWHHCRCMDCGATGPRCGDETEDAADRDRRAVETWTIDERQTRKDEEA